MHRPSILLLLSAPLFLLNSGCGGRDAESRESTETSQREAQAGGSVTDRGAEAASSDDPAAGAATVAAETNEWATLDEADWRKRLEPQEFQVLREEGTERAFTGDLLDEKRPGTFTCAGCGLPLFVTATKFESGTGWPSFYEPLNDTNVGESTDHKLGYARTEVHCARCGGHLGHVFPDGPEPTGLRYCINSVALDFEPAK